MKICPNCNHENSDSSLFCSNCGNKLPIVTEKEEMTSSEIRFDPLTGERISGNPNSDRFAENNQARENNNPNPNQQGYYGYNQPYNSGYTNQANDPAYGLALAGLLVSLIVSEIIGLGLSIAALCKDYQKKHLGLEIAGIVVGGLSLILKIVLIVYFINNLESYGSLYGYVSLFL